MKVSNIVSLSILAAASTAAAAESYPGEDKNRNDPEQQPGAHSPETYALSAKDQQAVVEEHNIKRALHVDTPPLVWDDTLAQFAEKLAAQYSCYSGELHHSGADYGENLALGYSAVGAVDGWYNEIKSYNYSSSAIQPATGHFTQVVWRDSKRVGCAIRYCNSYWGNYMICEYDPSGNYLGEFADNVMPLKVSLNGDGDASSSVTASASASATASAQSSSLGTAVYSQSSRLYGNTTVATSHTSSAMASNKARTSSIVATTKNHGSSMAASTKGTHASVTATTKQNHNVDVNAAAPTTTVQDNIASKTGDSVVKIRTVYTTNGVVVTTFTTYCPESDKTIQTPVPEQTTTTTKNAPAAAAVTATTTTTCSTAANVAKAQDVKSTTTVATVAKGQDVEATTTTVANVANVAKTQDAEATTTTVANVANVAKTQEATSAAVTTTLEGTITPSAPHIEQQTGVQGSTQSTSVSEAHVGDNTESAPGLQAFEGSASNMNPNFLLGAIAMIFMSLL